jgi:hypothetical protein
MYKLPSLLDASFVANRFIGLNGWTMVKILPKTTMAPTEVGAMRLNDFVILMLLYDIRITSLDCLGLDEDALAGALFGGFDDHVELVVGEVSHAVATLGVSLRGSEDFRPLFYVGQAVIEQHENSGCDFHADTVTGTKVLINPNFHDFPTFLRSTPD